MITIMFLSAVAIIIGLMVYAFRLWRQVFQQKQARQQQQKAREEETSQRRAEITDSASRLADALLNHDLNLSEGVIRLKVMLDHLVDENDRQDFHAIYAMEEAVSGFAKREEREKLNGMQRLIQDAEREKIEARYRTDVRQAAEAVIVRFGAPDIGGGKLTTGRISQPHP